MLGSTLYSSSVSNLQLLHNGKVRDIYAVDENHLLIVTTDRMSAFDVIMPTPIPEKGRILNQISAFWFDYFKGIIPNQLSSIQVKDVVTNEQEYQQIKHRAIVVKKLKALPIEAIVRGYIIGSGWKDYQKTNAICGISLPQGLKLADKLPEAIYTPSSKASVGMHDENINFEASADLIGIDLANQIKDVSLAMYKQASEFALTKGIIIADTKFEFGLDDNNQLTLIDEVLTPDSSRFWHAKSYQAGTSPKSFDKQYIRDYLEGLVKQSLWDKKAPGPELPNNVVEETQKKYQQALELLINSCNP